MKSYVMALAVCAALITAGCGAAVGKKDVPASSAASSQQEVADVHPIDGASEKNYHKAVMAYGKGSHTEALQLANQALDQDPKNYKALSLQGIILAFDSSPEEGIVSIQKSLEINPHYTQAFFDMAMAQKLGKHYDESIFYFEKVIQVDPKNTWSYYGIATNYADKRDKAKALDYLKKAMALDPDHVRGEAKTQDHFAWMRNDKDFQTIVQ